MPILGRKRESVVGVLDQIAVTAIAFSPLVSRSRFSEPQRIALPVTSNAPLALSMSLSSPFSHQFAPNSLDDQFTIACFPEKSER